ncbi:nitrite reductase small subunit NirD [Sphingomonas sp. TDK1]|jgi:nitrite reductase (NADH) small subunit|uniref:nitrite reductase small subunit NirD n=1 Tax=Sphingomonas sp. TDK1 TaxID=453247 RepID=UPI0007D911C4|nr:nitrite reductase small subunit NirD [Sphingomonas sp. TDK1]OAN63763.1 nitrite reductase [Sphingomonas sp. TDK1]
MTVWTDIGTLADLPLRGSRTLTLAGEPVAVFRTHDDQVFALIDRCPHKGGPLSAGIVHGHAVACPLHNLRISLATGTALEQDAGCTPVVPVRMEGERILLASPVRAAA